LSFRRSTPESRAINNMQAPENKDTEFLIGHEAAERALASQFKGGKMPHAILLSGPKGIGKATLGWRMARYVFSQGETGGLLQALPQFEIEGYDNSVIPAPSAEGDSPFQISKASSIFSRLSSGGVQDFKLVEREWADEAKSRRKTEITVEQIRALKRFFETTSSEEGWRVALIDSADEMNKNAANALLKILEEPPAKSLLILVSHNPDSLLPTIRSRCRSVRLGRLSPVQMDKLLAAYLPNADETQRKRLAELANGSIGSAISLWMGDALPMEERFREAVKGKESIGTVANLAAANFGAFKVIALRHVEDKIRADKTGGDKLFELRGWLVEQLANVGELNLDPALAAFAIMERIRKC